MRTGVVKFFNTKNKFGFIVDDETKKDFYVHIQHVKGTIQADDKVSFELQEAKRGQECINVKKV